MQISHLLLTPGALRAILEEFVTRDGTDNSEVEQRIQHVHQQLELGTAQLHFEQATATCNIVRAGNVGNPPEEIGED